MNGLEEMPVTAQRVKDGELSHYLLPTRGYSVEQLAQWEEERIQKEIEAEMRREREEAERRRALEEERLLRDASEAMIPALMDSTTKTRSHVSDFEMKIVNARKVPGEKSSANMTMISDVANFVGNLSAIRGAMPVSLIPDGTAMAPPEAYLQEQFVFESDEDEVFYSNGDLQEFAVEAEVELSNEGAEHVESDVTADSNEGSDGLSLRDLSIARGEGILYTDDIKAEEDDLREECEIFETEEILNASPNAEDIADCVPRSWQNVSEYNETKLNTFSQLGDLTADDVDLGNSPVYEERLEPQNSSLTVEVSSGDTLSPEPIGQFLEDSPQDPALPEPSNSNENASHLKTYPTSETSDEQVPPDQEQSDDEPSASTIDRAAYEEYERQVAEMREIEESELLETEAILNAPPAADTVDWQEEDDSAAVENATADDDLSILEMDEVDELSNTTSYSASEFTTNGELTNNEDSSGWKGGTLISMIRDQTPIGTFDVP